MDTAAVVHKIKCPDCAATFDEARQLGPHRNKAHGYRVSDGKNKVSRAQKHGQPRPKKKRSGNRTSPHLAGRNKLNGSYPCPECEFVAKWSGGLTKHMRNHNPSQPLSKTKAGRSLKVERTAKAEIIRSNGNGHFIEAGQAPPHDPISETVLAIALGRFQGLCQSMATEFDVPPRMFAARLCELVYRSQVR